MLMVSASKPPLPKEVPELEGWQISPYYQAAREVGRRLLRLLRAEGRTFGPRRGGRHGQVYPQRL